jgi:hypothetical protein
MFLHFFWLGGTAFLLRRVCVQEFGVWGWGVRRCGSRNGVSFRFRGFEIELDLGFGYPFWLLIACVRGRGARYSVAIQTHKKEVNG